MPAEWQMGFNSAFKGLIISVYVIVLSKHLHFNLSSNEPSSGIKHPVFCVHAMN